MKRPTSSRERYRQFLRDYKARKFEQAARDGRDGDSPEPPRPETGKRREYLRDYVAWLKPYRGAVAALFVFALLAAGLDMIEPLFLRFIVDRVLLNAALDTASRLI